MQIMCTLAEPIWKQYRTGFYAGVEPDIKPVWVERNEAETDETFLQIIPTCVVVCEEMILLYRRRGTEERLHGLESILFGGHCEESVCSAALRRELHEELGIGDLTPSYLGMVLENISAVGRVHLGLVHMVNLPEDREPHFSEETSIAKWIPKKHYPTERMELWSALVYQHFQKEL